MDKTLTNKQKYIYEANNTCKHCKPLARLGVSESGMADANKSLKNKKNKYVMHPKLVRHYIFESKIPTHWLDHKTIKNMCATNNVQSSLLLH